MLINRNRARFEKPRACPRCSQTPAPLLVHIEGLTFLCDRCLHEIHAQPRRRRTGVAVVGAVLALSSTFLKVNE